MPGEGNATTLPSSKRLMWLFPLPLGEGRVRELAVGVGPHPRPSPKWEREKNKHRNHTHHVTRKKAQGTRATGFRSPAQLARCGPRTRRTPLRTNSLATGDDSRRARLHSG